MDTGSDVERGAAPIRVLVVDDHTLVAEALSDSLAERDGIDVVATTGTVAGAVDLALRHRPDVVLMDYRLPDGDGATATRRIKQDAPDVAVVMVTSVTDDATLVRSIDAGAAGFVPKDSPMEEVVGAIRAASAGESLITPSVLGRVLATLRQGPTRMGTDLTPREMETLRLLTEGLANDEIARRMSISLNTVRNHVQSIITKLGAHSKLQAVAIAVREGIVDYRGGAS